MSPGTSKLPDGEISSHELHSNLLSHLRQRLRGSFGASTMELQHISKVLEQKKTDLAEEIQDHETEIQKLQMEVGRHQATLINLKNKLRGLETYSPALGSLLAPIRRLPAEILVEIFAHFCDKIYISGNSSIPPLKLATVCSSWRDLALSTSRLWNRIEVNTSGWLSIDRLRCIELLANLVLDYSGNAPLHLLVQVYFYPNFMQTQWQDAAVSIIKPIARHSYHWRHLTLELSNDLFHEMNPFIKDLPLLESLTVSSVTPLDMVNMAPKLRHVELQGIDEPIDLKLPWHQILRLKFDSTKALSKIVACLRLCTSLQRLELASFHSLSEQDLDDPLTMHNLESLFLGLEGAGDLKLLFSLLTFPQLTNFSLSCTNTDGPGWVWNSIFRPIADSLLIHSSRTITSLTLRSVPLTDDKLIYVFQHLPSVEELSITQCDYPESDYPEGPFLSNVTNSLITSLHVLHSGFLNNALYQPLLPKLLTIDLTMYRWCAPSYEALVALVKSRWLPDSTYAADIGVVCLKSVAFHFKSVLDHECGPLDHHFNSLWCLRDAGLKFTTSSLKDFTYR